MQAQKVLEYENRISPTRWGTFSLIFYQKTIVLQPAFPRPTPQTTLGYSNTSSLKERVTQANTWKADYFISIHANASENPDINGTEAYVSSANSAAWYLAQNIVSEIVRRTSTKYNGVFTRPSLYVLKNTKMPAVLVELGYITNYEDNQRMIDNPYQFAYGIYVGILNYLELPQKNTDL